MGHDEELRNMLVVKGEVSGLHDWVYGGITSQNKKDRRKNKFSVLVTVAI